MDPATIMAILGGLSTLKGMLTGTPSMENYLEKFAGKRLKTARAGLETREAKERRRATSKWGVSGVISGAGERAERRKIGRDYSELWANIEAQTRAGAEATGMTAFQSELSKALGERGAWSQLGGLMMTPLAMQLGTQAAQPKETPQATPQGDIAEILRALGLTAPPGVGESQEALQYLLPYLLQGLGR